MQETERLLNKLRKGNCSAEELQASRALLKKEDALADWLDQELEQMQPAALNEAQRATLWDKIAADIATKEPKVVPLHPTVRIRKLAYRWASVAAIFLLAFFAWQYLSQPAPTTTVVLEGTASGKAQPQLLPDGSTVWLNRNSKIQYQSNLSNKMRFVQLEGEAFFEVATDSLQPFIVTAGDIQTTVLGTAFNVQAFSKNGQIKVALRSGKVSVTVVDAQATTILQPGEMFTYNKKNQSFTTQSFIENAPYAWKDGIIYFDGASVQEVATVLENWYGIKFILKDAPRMNSELVTRFDATRMTMEQILQGIAQVTDYQFEKKNRTTILVKPD